MRDIHSIRQSQYNYFNGFEVGCGEDSAYFFQILRKYLMRLDINIYV